MPRLLVDLAPLRESRDFRLLFSGQLVSMLGNQFTIVATGYQAFHLTHSSLQVGAISGVQFPFLLAGTMIGGTVGDAVDKRRLLGWSALGLAAISGGLATNAAVAHPSLLALYVLSAAAALLAGFSNPSRTAAIPRLVGPGQLLAAYSLNQITIQVATVVGPALGGVLAGVDLPACFAVDAVSFGAIMVATLLMAPIPPSHGSPPPGLAAVREGFSFLRGRQVLQGVFLLDLDAMVLGMPSALFPAFALTRFHGGGGILGLLYAAPGLGALIGAATTGWVERLQVQGRAVVVAVVGWGLAIAAFGAVPWLWVALLCLAVAGFADVISAVLRNTILQRSIPDHFRSRLSAIQMAVVQGGPRLGNLEAGGVAAASTPSISAWTGGLGCAAGAVVLALLLPRFTKERREVIVP